MLPMYSVLRRLLDNTTPSTMRLLFFPSVRHLVSFVSDNDNTNPPQSAVGYNRCGDRWCCKEGCRTRGRPAQVFCLLSIWVDDLSERLPSYYSFQEVPSRLCIVPLPGDTGTIVAITARATTGPTTTATIMDTTTTTADPTLQSGTSSPWRWKTKTETEVNSDFDPGCCSRRCCWRLQAGNSPWLDFNRPAIVLFTNIQFYSSLT